jgi:hypothetical protein
MESPDELNFHKKWRGHLPSMESLGNIWVKALGSKISKLLLGIRRGFKILPSNDDKMLSHKLWEYLPTATSDRDSPRFSDDKSPQGGNPSDPWGIGMRSEMMKDGSPKGQYWR